MTHNLDAVRAAYDAFATGNLDTFLAALAPDFTSTQSDAVPWRGTHRGRDAVRQMFTIVARHTESGYEPHEYIDGGNRIVVIGTATLTPAGQNHTYEIRELHVWGARDGVLHSLDVFLNTPAPLLTALDAETAPMPDQSEPSEAIA